MLPHLPPQDIQDLLAAWAQHLKAAERIFLRVPRHNRALLFGGRNPVLAPGDPRVCHIPLSTRRATLREVLRVHTLLASLQVYGESAQPLLQPPAWLGTLLYGAEVPALQPSSLGDVGCSLSLSNDRSTLAAQRRTRHWKTSLGPPGRTGRKGSRRWKRVPYRTKVVSLSHRAHRGICCDSTAPDLQPCDRAWHHSGHLQHTVLCWAEWQGVLG